MIRCYRCRLTKDDEEFTKCSKKKNGKGTICKSCRVECNKNSFERRKKYCQDRREILEEKRKDYAEKNKEWLKEKRKKSYANNKEYWAIQNKKQREKNRNKYNENSKKWAAENKEYVLKYQKEYRGKNRDKLNAHNREYQRKNKPQLRVKANERRRQRMKNDIEFKLLHNLRRRLGLVLEGKRKSETTRKLIGCDLKHLKNHLEGKFTEEMNWGNYGTFWEIDHIVPCKEFNLLDMGQQKICFHYTNLQPLTCEENRSKGAKILTK